MWLYTEYGFYNIVADQQHPGCLLVRGRCRSDVERFEELLRGNGYSGQLSVMETPKRDYRYRLEGGP